MAPAPLSEAELKKIKDGIDQMRLEVETWALARAKELGLSHVDAASGVVIAGAIMGQRLAVSSGIPFHVAIATSMALYADLLETGYAIAADDAQAAADAPPTGKMH